VSGDFDNHFASIAKQYAEFRPHYPDGLVDLLAEHCTQHELAWDAGCGSGQLTVALTRRFANVVGTDPSPEQLQNAQRNFAVRYSLATADLPLLDARSVDLAVSAQAAHWFHWTRYVAEVERVTRPGAVVALVSYGILSVEGREADAIMKRYYLDVAGPYWPPERRHVENGYRDLRWPWPEIETPPTDMTAQWTRDELVGYVSTWSATVRMIKALGPEPYQQMTRELAAVWPEEERRTITWPLTVRRAHRS
jgi:SAM-dependent methyltransferase